VISLSALPHVQVEVFRRHTTTRDVVSMTARGHPLEFFDDWLTIESEVVGGVVVVRVTITLRAGWSHSSSAESAGHTVEFNAVATANAECDARGEVVTLGVSVFIVSACIPTSM
jgi:hypothetical protein